MLLTQQNERTHKMYTSWTVANNNVKDHGEKNKTTTKLRVVTHPKEDIKQKLDIMRVAKVSAIYQFESDRRGDGDHGALFKQLRSCVSRLPVIVSFAVSFVERRA